MSLTFPPGLVDANDVPFSKLVGEEKEQLWEQLTEEGPSGSSDSEKDNSLHLSASDTEQGECISGFVSSSTSDNENEPVAELPQLPHPRSPQRRSRKAPLAEVLSSKLLQVSAGRPVKVWLSPDYKPFKVLDPNIPAKKKPSFSEHAGKTKVLDPMMPVKKHIPEWLVNFGDSTAPAKPKPPKMPVRVPQVAQATDALAPR